MPRNSKLFLDDIIEAIHKIEDFVIDDSYDTFIEDYMKRDAVLWNLEVIGEAANKIPQVVRNKYSFVEWRKIVDFRNILAHEYFGIDFEIVWDIIKNKLPELRKSIEKIITEEGFLI